MKLPLRSAVAALVIMLLASSLAKAGEPDAILPLDGGTGWVNSAPLTLADLRGKVVLVDFWEYTCVNCLRTLPYLREWYKRYAKYGFVIVGVHTPEFTFSADAKNVEAAMKRLDVTWPVVLDNNETLWKRYSTNNWPHELLFDQTGKRNDSVIGEGAYTETEQRIQFLLKRADPSLQLPPIMALLPQDSYSKPGAVCYPKTDETFVGGQNARIGNPPPQAARDQFGQQTSPLSGLTLAMYYDKADHKDGLIYLQGSWRKVSQGLTSMDGREHLALKYHAIQVVGVLRPEGAAQTVIVTQDGKPLAHEDAGSDIQYDAQGRSYMTVDAPRAYDIVDNKKWATHDLMLEPQAAGVGIYSFDFESCETPG
jgi:thiol-disulfide isomerase/thioredoxin